MSRQFLDADRIYNLTQVWTIHLEFAPDQWEALEPQGGGASFFGGRPGAGGAGNGDRTLAPVFLSQGDANRDARISREEFDRLAAKWFSAWDTARTGRLDREQIRAGLDQIRNPAGGGIATRMCSSATR